VGDLKQKIVMALSGGMDSATCLGYFLNQGADVVCLGFTYGAKHNQYENEAATAIAEHYGVPYNRIDLTKTMEGFKSNLLKTGGDIPEGHYTDQSMSLTVVPARNIIFLSIMAGYAESVGAGKISIGIHQGDHAIYADCRTEFYKAMDTAIFLGTDKKVEIVAPFINEDKTGILKIGLDINVPYHLTRTCYKDQPLSCGKCGSCVERLEAFNNIGLNDPIKYELLE